MKRAHSNTSDCVRRLFDDRTSMQKPNIGMQCVIKVIRYWIIHCVRNSRGGHVVIWKVTDCQDHLHFASPYISMAVILEGIIPS